VCDNSAIDRQHKPGQTDSADETGGKESVYSQFAAGMQNKSRFDRLPKRDRDEVLRIDGLQVSWAPSPEEYAAITLRRLREHREKLQGRTSSSLLAGSLH
jgi:hypothetical protein